jgi:hypothetical protein
MVQVFLAKAEKTNRADRPIAMLRAMGIEKSGISISGGNSYDKM